jgi:hypothetical protein
LPADRTILRQNRSVAAPVNSQTNASFRFYQKVFRFALRHRREIVNVQFALRAMPRAFVADHLVPIGETWRGDLHFVEWVCEFTHKNSTADLDNAEKNLFPK